MLLLILIPLIIICSIYYLWIGWTREEFRYWFIGFKTLYTRRELVKDIIVVFVLTTGIIYYFWIR